MRDPIVRSLAPALAALLLTACGGGGSNNVVADGNASEAAATAAGGTLLAIVGGDGDLETLAQLAQGAGLSDVLSGVGPYTVFAPTDAAFEAAGSERSEALTTEAMRPQAAALLRAHIVPGAVTRGDLNAALARDGAAPVRMRNMAGSMLTFTREGEGIVVASDRGGRARLSGAERPASNGAVQPIDALLLPMGDAAR